MPTSDYVTRLRSRIGNDLLLLPAVSVLIWDGDKRLLLVEQSELKQWGTVGGMIEPDEAPAAAARREAYEETGCRVQIDGIRDVVGGPDYRATYPNGDQVCYVSVVYDAHIVAGTPIADGDEISQVRWVAPAQLAALELHPFGRNLLSQLGLLDL